MEVRGFSMAELARRAKVRPNTLTNWKSGRTANPRKNDIASVCQALRIRPEWLLLDQGPMEEEGARETGLDYMADGIDPLLLGQCFEAVMGALEKHSGPRPPSSKIGAAMAEIYIICQRDGRKPTDDLVASFIRVLLA